MQTPDQSFKPGIATCANVLWITEEALTSLSVSTAETKALMDGGVLWSYEC